MIINRPGATFTYEDVVYTIGEKVFANGESDYHGLIGHIYEIRDGEDKETENDGPDFYCSFEPPVSPSDITALEEYFSDLYGTPKTLEDITLDMVIMGPEMVTPFKHIEDDNRKLNIYMVREKWNNDGQNGSSIYLYTEFEDAKTKMTQLLIEESATGLIARWKDKEEFQVDSGSHFYKCWVSDSFCENHYHVALVMGTLYLSPKAFGMIGRAFVDESRREDFVKQIEPWEELGKITSEQHRILVNDPDIPERIHSALGKNDGYWESYWETVSEVAHTIVNEHIARNTHSVTESAEENE